MKLILEHNDNIYTSSTGDTTLDEIVSTFKGLLVSAGYHPTSVDQYFPEEESWFPEVAGGDPDPEGSTRDQLSKKQYEQAYQQLS